MPWFNRKQKNRRLGRIHVLDVKLRSDQVRATRVRLLTKLFGVIFGVTFGLYVLWRAGDWALDRLVYENPSFAIQQVEVETDGVISPEQLRRWAGVRAGQNLLALDLAAVKRNLELASNVKAASIERVLPRTLRIRVQERQPVAQVNMPRPAPNGAVEVVAFHVDPEGVVLQPLDPRQRMTVLNKADDALPVLTGLGTVDLQPGRGVETPQMQAALKLISVFECSPMAGVVGLRRIDVGYQEILIVTTEEGSEITLGLDDLERQLRRWRELHDYGQSIRKTIATLNLAVANHSPLTWAEASVTPVEPAKKTQTPRTRRRNV
ncbi:MAG TPA: FtsQ-type POTRA domain-containing protein [Verrucomicrobiota bacterium]|nr:FtsQ-type POTRA domain-containing protein [Verrucomicrobiota bacterium]